MRQRSSISSSVCWKATPPPYTILRVKKSRISRTRTQFPLPNYTRYLTQDTENLQLGCLALNGWVKLQCWSLEFETTDLLTIVPIRHVLPGFNTIPRFSGSLRSRLPGATTVGVLSEPSHDTGNVEDTEGLPPWYLHWRLRLGRGPQWQVSLHHTSVVTFNMYTENVPCYHCLVYYRLRFLFTSLIRCLVQTAKPCPVPIV